ncbi:hypothetical protein BO70DRAFT_400702 [Aspergillus heteromorphus CBS 117.55]|uniref:Uncharacterized protein n=1 Tax=Aspergillus heteromorphus CBS 117.55 TaxID=1448321 RepID=A0A317UZD7_9EURO|nr:uncharacterized protein BO70DRAFT_400702 [Aspergillus heteromorphus CBS 117.55]PWY66719.1 hypothetical protein BO70DRAFT_400702 [Aspergillus heteromorphus CBS 117.55]
MSRTVRLAAAQMGTANNWDDCEKTLQRMIVLQGVDIVAGGFNTNGYAPQFWGRDLSLCHTGRTRTLDFTRLRRIEHYGRITSQTGTQPSHPSPAAILSTSTALPALRPLISHHDALLVACFSHHPLIRALREEHTLPVIGIMEASLFAGRTPKGESAKTDSSCNKTNPLDLIQSMTSKPQRNITDYQGTKHQKRD